MTAPKKPTVSSLQRKVSRLEAQVNALQLALTEANRAYTEAISRSADLTARIWQAVDILQGKDE